MYENFVSLIRITSDSYFMLHWKGERENCTFRAMLRKNGQVKDLNYFFLFRETQLIRP